MQQVGNHFNDSWENDVERAMSLVWCNEYGGNEINFLVRIANVLVCDVEVREVFGTNMQQLLLTTGYIFPLVPSIT